MRLPNPFIDTWAPRTLSVLRIVTGFMFMMHGMQKILGFPVARATQTVLLSLSGVAGLMELIGGALILLGLFTIWLALAGIRMVGSVAEARLRTQHAPTSAAGQPIGAAQTQTESAVSPLPNPLMAMLANMKNSLESGRVGEAVRTIDPLPPSLYRVLEKAGQVASDARSAEKFLSYPGAREISDHPKVVALRNDARVMELIASGHIFELMKNPCMIEAMNDPALQARVKKFDLERALDYALKKN